MWICVVLLGLLSLLLFICAALGFKSNKNRTMGNVLTFLGVLVALTSLAFSIIAFNASNETDKEQSVNDLLHAAEQAFISEDYLDTLKIYLDESLKRDPVALNNLGYMLVTGTGTAEDIPKGLAYYKQAAKLGNITALDNYILSMLLYPTTYDEVLEALKWGHEEERPVVENFIENMFLSPQIVDQYGNIDPSEFWTGPKINRRSWLEKITVESEIVNDSDILGTGNTDFIGERCSRKVNEKIGYKTVTTPDGHTVIEEVYGIITQLGYKTYRLQYVDFLDMQQAFIYLDQ